MGLISRIFRTLFNPHPIEGQVWDADHVGLIVVTKVNRIIGFQDKLMIRVLTGVAAGDECMWYRETLRRQADPATEEQIATLTKDKELR